ncbi:integrase domain-containing protein [Peristeroidobacter agariperforans]|uniref:integrase domain-containing protein n=1 Tax=Peristeroidobacter agariperforans TaxID=268404 RepID=UPI0018E54E73|nr:integrase domain-containing protein [Peristeroidobacter agariperforans]
MSRKTELRADLHRIGYELSGAHLTREARCGTFNTFARIMRELGYGIQAASQIGGRHLQAFTQRRTSEGIAARTLANEMSHLRAVLKHIDKQGLATNPAYNNRALGIGRGSRLGTKQPLSDDAIRAFQQRMERLGRPSLGVLLELQRSLGLREVEAIRGGQMEPLTRWQRELEEHGSVRVIAGTKGARPRDVHPANVGRALAAVRAALAFLEASGQRYLVTRVDGAGTTGLKQAISVYKNVCDRAGIQSHSARYAFAAERMQAYRAEGFSEREARAATSLDLGHGDGRGRYVASVYARSL